LFNLKLNGRKLGFNTPLRVNIGDLKFRDWAKLWIIKLIIKKSNFKKSVMTSFSWRHHHYIT